MATLLSIRYSVERCLNLTRRHQRLCKQVVNDGNLANQIEPAKKELSAKNDQVVEKIELRENAYDDLFLSDRNLDDGIRNAYDAAKQHDREQPGDSVLIKIFPDEKYGDIVRLPFLKEVQEVEKIVVRIESLGEAHPLFPQAEKLKTLIARVKEVMGSYTEAIRQHKLAEAEMEIARELLVRQYEISYLDARKKYGKITAEKLFPRAWTYSPGKEDKGIEDEVA